MPPRSRSFGPRGRRLWAELAAASTLDPASAVLAEEACRMADRLDKLDALITGRSDEWLRFRHDQDGGAVTVIVDNLLGEARQQANVLRGLVAQLEKSRPAAEPEKPAEGASDELARKRAARMAGAAAS